MITSERVRGAVLSPDPAAELDRLVRDELAAGRKTAEVFNDLLPVARELRKTVRLSEDADQILLGTLDALTGNCDPDQCYQNPPNDTLPGEAEIAALPRWAQVAFAARCARRVFGHFAYAFAVVPPDRIQAVEGAVSVAEENAEVGAAREQLTRNATSATLDVMLVYDEHLPALLSALNTAHAAAETNPRKRVECVRVACSQAADAAEGTNIRPIIRRDFDHLSRLAEWQRWDDDTAVPPDVFGPLWPEGPPKGWPAPSDVPQRAELVVEAFARERATEGMIEDDLVHLFNALNRYHIARSGVRLTLDQFRALLPALVPVEV